MSSFTIQHLIDVPRDLLIFPEAPRPNQACVRCTSKGWWEPPAKSIADIYGMATSNCPFCSLIGRAAIRADGTILYTMANPPTSPSAPWDFPSRVYLTVDGAMITIDYSPHGDHIHEILLYTQFGQAKCSGSIFKVARELDCPTTTYKDIITGWLETCDTEHRSCTKGSNPLPSRVLDIGSAKSRQIRLCVTEGASASYTALSYCWGEHETITTTKENYKAHLAGIRFATLPPTLADAVTITRALGIRYLWIDALCIIQDDEPDWEVESGNMAAVYQNAYLVISADSAANVHEGFLAQKKHRPQGFPVAFVGNDRATIFARSKDVHKNPVPLFKTDGGKYPAQRRAWTLQEQVLANRLVHFIGDEMVWECQSCMWCECMELDNLHISSREFKISNSSQRTEYSKALASTDSAKFRYWYHFVDTLVRRYITNDLDILPALSGLAKQMQKNGAGRYCAGIWADDLVYGLMWCPPSLGLCGRAIPYRAPSWSWASVKIEDPASNIYNFTEHSELQILCTVLNVQCTPSGKDPLGTVSSGYLIISSPLLQARHIPPKFEDWHGWFDDLSFGEFEFVQFENTRLGSAVEFAIKLDIPPSELTQAGVFDCLILGTRGQGFTNYFGIALEPKDKDSSPNTFERVGWFEITDNGSTTSALGQLEAQVVKIV